MEDARVGLGAAHARGVHDHGEEPVQADVGTDGLEIAVEVRHETEAVPAGQPGQDRRARADGVERLIDEARGDARAHRRIRHAQPGAHAGHESMHRVAERERRRNRSHQGIVGAIEHRGEALGLNVHALLTVEVKDPLLPGHARGVQRSAEVEQHGVRCTHASGLS